MPENRPASLGAICGPEIRAYLGQRLRAYYDFTQDIPLPASLARLIEQLAEPVDGPNEKNQNRRPL
jgi:hypothetical protein